MKDKLKQFFSRFGWYEICLISFGIIAITVLSIIVKSSAITIIYSIFGVLYTVLLSAKFKFSILFGLVQTSFYIIQSVMYQNWGEVILNSAVVLPILLTSTILWFTGKDKNDEKVTERKIKPLEWCIVGVIFVVTTIAFYFILSALNTQNAWLGCISCGLTVTSNYLLLRKSQFLFVGFILLNVVLFVLWLLPIVQGGGFGLESLPMLVTLVVYNISNIYGLIFWAKDRRKISLNEGSLQDKTQEELQDDEMLANQDKNQKQIENQEKDNELRNKNSKGIKKFGEN